MDPEGTRNDAPPTVVDMSLSAIHGSTNGSGRKDSACGQDFQITLRTARRAPPGPEPFAGTRKPDVRQKAPDRASSVPESQQERPRRTITLRPSVSPPRRTGPLPFRPYQSPPSARADARQHLSSIRPTPILAPSGRSTRSFPPAPVSAIYPKPRPSAPRRQPVSRAPAGIRALRSTRNVGKSASERKNFGAALCTVSVFCYLCTRFKPN